MNVLLISQCSKRALTETRRILDQFAERRGDRTWQTAITMDGLSTLRKLLRKTARKNSAIACHWIRGKDHSELMWVVGDASQFNAEGTVPTNTTQRDVLRQNDENTWHSLQAIRLLSALAALLHDLGKSCLAFQEKLKPNAAREKNLYRHEWVSVRLFQAFVGSDNDEKWLQRLGENELENDQQWLEFWLGDNRILRDGLDDVAVANKPLADLPPIAQAVAWLVLTHHRLPVFPAEEAKGGYGWYGKRLSNFNSGLMNNLLENINANWNEPCSETNRDKILPFWSFPHGLPVTTPRWRKQASRLANKLLPLAQKPESNNWLDDPYIMHVSRLSLMLADHHYSSLSDENDRKKYLNNDYPLYANTQKNKQGKQTYNQTLDEHLLGVEGHANTVVHALPCFEFNLPRLARHKGLKKRSTDARFRWQDKAADLAAAVRDRTQVHGAFIVNMASTGCGKTLGNARIMNALSDPAKGMRCAFAIGLRTLTLQTGRSFRDDLGLGDDELAIKVGGAANRELFEYYEQLAESSGSASRQELLAEDGHVLFEGNDEHPLLQRLIKDAQVRRLLAAPLLVCTIDHLTPATESLRGGRQIAPMLRLMSGDLVLDEPDDFDIDDLPALTRLVHWAGLLGSRVLLSSATLPPSLVEGLFLAYQQGRTIFQRNRGERPSEKPAVCCIWVDEYDQLQADCAQSDQFKAAHQSFVNKRYKKLGTETIRRRSELLPLEFSTQNKKERRNELALKIQNAASVLHQIHHSIDKKSGKRVSFGLIRMANIDPLVDVALALYQHGAPENVYIHLCVYHSQFPLIIRSAIEYQLDTALNRRSPDAVFELPAIRAVLDKGEETDHLFIVLGSPVTEVGRDHDYDWAIVEPSSVRSLIQLAGRIRRHRHQVVDTANMLILDTNLRHFENPGKAAFCKPGFEQNSAEFTLNQHRLALLLTEDERKTIDARPRILPREDEHLRPKESLVDLEHVRLQKQMLPDSQAQEEAPRRSRFAPPPPKVNASSFWHARHASLTGVLQQEQPFRHDNSPSTDLVFLPDEDEEGYRLHKVTDGNRKWEKIYTEIDESLHHRVPDEAVQGERIAPWGQADFMALLLEQAEGSGMGLQECARKFATASLRDATQGWWFHPVLGFVKNY